ncbi:hypothetical protein [Deinococcus yavapaiensis]|uniref:Uncharacterized protein n=1 Tax=Deinococcus yavapaiensis KR-236 TaxID=694435 RepID=A0A318SB05_9DEIO|nr:hypothetical protein [Deinococcus yavapaiensis]PYE53799.1 hypothetical protein DES52_10757 [Deinococcus yavapaiensis KR-236]
MNAQSYVAQNRAEELRAEAERARQARAASTPHARPNLLRLVKVLLLARQPRLA